MAVLTAGPGVTHGISAITTAWFNGSPLVVLGGRAPQSRWGMGDLQELDHAPIVSTITKRAATAFSPEDIPKQVAAAVADAVTPHRGPVFVDVPMDVLFGAADVDVPPPVEGRGPDPDPDDIARAASLLASAARPALLAGGDVWFDGAGDALQRCVESLRVPTFLNGQGRGCLPADHELFFSRVRGMLTSGDLVLSWSSPRIHWLPWADLGSRHENPACPSVTARPRMSGRNLPCTH